MSEQLERPAGAGPTPPRSLVARWAELCDRYLPLRAEGSIWRYSRESRPDDPEQGWKLHIPATVLSAGRVLQAVAPLLRGRGVLYKAPGSLRELDKLNCGLFYGYSQVGKFLTIYPRTTEEAVLLARKLHRLTRGMEAPSVPFDTKYMEGGCVYYRYGAFKTLEVRGRHGDWVYAVRDPGGNLVPDDRESPAAPEWATDPFPRPRARAAEEPPTPLKTTYKAFRALAQRGKGGVYQAFDLSVTPPRLCVLKEGRRNGEVGWHGRDGFWRVRHEGQVLDALRAAGLDVPRVYSSFETRGSYYLVIEFVEGEDLNSWLGRRRRRLAVAAALRLGEELARLVARIHGAGWAWRDLKPGNVIVTKGGGLRPLDFEGACPAERPDPEPWGTPAFMPPEAEGEFKGQSRVPDDLYSLGAVVYLLLAGRTPDAGGAAPVGKLRKGIPELARRLVAELLDPDPSRRPDARAAAERLRAAAEGKTSGAVTARGSRRGRAHGSAGPGATGRKSGRP